MQRLRGRIYLNDGAITTSELSPDGRHILPSDSDSWHLLTTGENGEVLGCTRILQHGSAIRFDDLQISRSALASSEEWGGRLRAAVEHDLRDAAKSDFSYVEIGGWALGEKIRCTAECLRSVLAIYAWSRLVGGAIGVSTATERNGSASILQRLGGHPMQSGNFELPAYYDPHYDCRMHLLRYDSRMPAPRYGRTIENLEKVLAGVPVITPERPLWQPIFSGFSATADRLSLNSQVAKAAA